MLYCTYDQYAAVGGTLDEAAFDPCARASRLIDRHTFGRAEPHARPVPGAPPCWPMPASRSSMP
ncbi:MAG: hypothetical protein ACLUIR_03260 [Faecalibacterium prausnitzii]